MSRLVDAGTLVGCVIRQDFVGDMLMTETSMSDILRNNYPATLSQHLLPRGVRFQRTYASNQGQDSLL